jgi:hypothetical protein
MNKKLEHLNKEIRKEVLTSGRSAIKNNVANLRGRLNQHLEKYRVLLPTSSPRSSASHELCVFGHQIEEDIISSDIDTNRIELWHKHNGEGGGWYRWKAPHQKLNAKSQGLQMNETTYGISKREVNERSVNDHSKLQNA